MSDQTTDPAGGPIKAPLSKRWLFKMGVFIVVLGAVGAWGFYDATVVYPERGEKFASWAEWQYLVAAQSADAESFGVFLNESSVPDPVGELARLKKPETLDRNQNDRLNDQSSRRLRAQMAFARMKWLNGLKVIGKLSADRTTISNPRQRLAELQQVWASANAPKPLSWYDLPTQWVFFLGGASGALLLLIHMVRIAAKKYVWHPHDKRLVLPGGHELTPETLGEVDKRKWDKFIVFLRAKEGHPTLGTREVRVDTYQHALVEDWILEMEKAAFGDETENAAPSSADEEDVERDAEEAAAKAE
ncbi:MAG: hypothetical protein R3B49_00760 [Phycisphaerales bacterium]